MPDIPLKQLANNPWQMWPLDPEHVADLAAEYAAGAPLPPIVVRRSPAPGRVGATHASPTYQIAVGHHRVAALLSLSKDDIPAEVRDLSDLEMARLAIAENFKRRVPSAIDKAHALQRLTAPPFSLSQAAAAKNLGYANQATVSHLLRLLTLPAPIQAHVHSGALPERLARGLISVARSLPQVAQKVADTVAKAEDKETVFDDALSNAVRQHGRPMWDAPWRQGGGKGDWTGPITYVADVAGKLGLTVLPPCKGCEFNLQDRNCARPACFDAKSTAWKWAEVGKAAKALGVAVAAPGEAGAGHPGGPALKLLFDGDPDDKPRAVAALKLGHAPEAVARALHASLRLVPTARAVRDYESETRARADLLGSKFAALATTDWPALKKALPVGATHASPAAPALTPAQRQAANNKQWKAVQAQHQAVNAELKRLVTVAATVLAPLLPDHEPLLNLLCPLWEIRAAWKAAKSLKAKKIVVMDALIDENGADLLDGDQRWDTPDGLRAGLAALLGLFKKRVPAALSAVGAKHASPKPARKKPGPKPTSGRRPAVDKPKVKPSRPASTGKAKPAPKRGRKAKR